MSKTGEDKPASKDNAPAAPANISTDTQKALAPVPAGPPRILGNQAKKQDEVTRQGTQKMKFIPTLPPRRPKPNVEVKQEEPPPPKPAERGRGRGIGPGRGRGRGGPPQPRPETQMVASGPFAMGPAMAGSSGQKRAYRPNFTPVMPSASGSSTGPSAFTGEKEKNRTVIKQEEEEIEVYSDPDEGVQIVDMNAVKAMDWMAPESLRRQRDDPGKKAKKKKMEALKKDAKGKPKERGETEIDVTEAEVEKNLANALDLSESDEEEEMEDLIEDFAQRIEDEESLTQQEKLYFFQFPRPFPTFTEDDAMDLDVTLDDKTVLTSPKADVPDKGKKVSFVDGVKPPGPDGPSGELTTEETNKPKKIDGVIGQLEVHQSGMIKMRLSNGMVLDVTAATQPSFLQHAIYLDTEAKKLFILGEVNRRFVVSPDVDRLLEEAEIVEAAARNKAENSGTPMDIT